MKMTPQILDSLIFAKFDDEDRDTATSGLCGTFALALYDYLESIGINPTPAVAYVGSISPEIYWRHALINFNDNLIDVEGIVLSDDVISNYCWGTISPSFGIHFMSISEFRKLIKGTKNSYCQKFYDYCMKKFLTMQETLLT